MFYGEKAINWRRDNKWESAHPPADSFSKNSFQSEVYRREIGKQFAVEGGSAKVRHCLRIRLWRGGGGGIDHPICKQWERQNRFRETAASGGKGRNRQWCNDPFRVEAEDDDSGWTVKFRVTVITLFASLGGRIGKNCGYRRCFPLARNRSGGNSNFPSEEIRLFKGTVMNFRSEYNNEKTRDGKTMRALTVTANFAFPSDESLSFPGSRRRDRIWMRGVGWPHLCVCVCESRKKEGVTRDRRCLWSPLIESNWDSV